MKKQFKALALLASMVLFSISLMAQAPNRFNYQAVAKNANGNPVTGVVKVKFSVLEATASGAVLYSEEHANVMADALGVFSAQIGGGTLLQGAWANISWGGAAKFLKVEIDFGGGYTAMGLPQQLVSVPYAEFADNTASWTVSSNGNLVYNTLSNIGIGTSAPGRKLHVNANEPQIRLSDPNGFVELYGGQNFQVLNANTILSTFWSGSQTSTPRLSILGKGNWNPADTEGDLQIGNSTHKLKFGIALGGGGAGNANMHTSGGILNFGQGTNYNILNLVGGNVGVGTLSPLTKFHVVGTGYFTDDLVVRKRIYAGDEGTDAQAADIVFGANNSGSGEWLGSKRTEGGNRYGLDFFTNSVSRLSIWNDGRVSINSGPLRVTGVSPVANAIFAYYFISGNGQPNTGAFNGPTKYSIWADDAVRGLQFQAVSDLRIKNVIGISDRKRDLAILNQIQIVDYYFKDRVGKGNTPQKKVIGQQLASVFPQAVSTDNTEIIPDIMQIAEAKDGWVSLPNTTLKKGEKVRLVLQDANKLEDLNVLEVNETGFKVNSTHTGKVLVYGREVNDFHVVDYEAIAMLNVSAVQELSRKVTALEEENERMKAQNEALLQRFAQLESKVNALSGIGSVNK